MWIIIKFKQNQFYTLKQEFKKKIKINEIKNYFSNERTKNIFDS